MKIDYHPLVGLPKKKSIIICEFIVLPNKRWVCPASGRGANKKPTKKTDKIGRWEQVPNKTMVGGMKINRTRLPTASLGVEIYRVYFFGLCVLLVCVE